MKLELKQLNIMSNNPSDNLGQAPTESLNNDNSTMKCKDDFCYLPNSDKEQVLKEENINIFDPI